MDTYSFATYLFIWVFWASAALIAYIYFGYPLLIRLLASLRPRLVNKCPAEPTVSILIAAYNEEHDIAKTLKNKLELVYPPDKLQILVISDGSTDATDEIVQDFAQRSGGRVQLLRQEPRQGKTSAINKAVELASGDILVFSDANSLYDARALAFLVENFCDPAVGYVTGKMIYTNPDGTLIGDGCSAFMKYENYLRAQETRLGSIVGVDGGIDAVRKHLYAPMRPDQLPDFVLPLKVAQEGYRVVFEPRALLKEQALGSFNDEYRMRVRVTLRALWALRDMRALLNPAKHGIYSLQLLSHKVLRYAAFAPLLVLLVCNALLLRGGFLYQVLFALQAGFYLMACISPWAAKRGVAGTIFTLPYYFVTLNVACAHAFTRFFKGERQILWQPRKG